MEIEEKAKLWFCDMGYPDEDIAGIIKFAKVMCEEQKQACAENANWTKDYQADADYKEYVFNPANRAKIELLKDIEEWAKNNGRHWINVLHGLRFHNNFMDVEPAYEKFSDRMHLLNF
jgi:hypothetical protein